MIGKGEFEPELEVQLDDSDDNLKVSRETTSFGTTFDSI